MKLWKRCLKIWEMLLGILPGEAVHASLRNPVEVKETPPGKRQAGKYEYSDERFCIADSNWCY